MSARAIPERLEPEVVAKHRESLSLRAISDWLRETHAISASHEAVAGVLHRHGVSPASLAESELIRTLSTRTGEVVDQLVECMNAFRELREQPFTPESKPQILSQLRILKEWSRIALGLLRGVLPRAARALGVTRPPNRSVEVANRRIDIASALAETKLQQAAQAVAPPTPPRNRPCPCGSNKKWKVCCGSPKKAAPLATGASGCVSG